MPPSLRLITLLLLLPLAQTAHALIPPTSCSGPADQDGGIGDLSVDYWAQQPASSTMCAYGYWAEKCGDHATAIAIFDRCIAAGYVGAMIWKAELLETGIALPRDDAAAAQLMHRAALSDDKDYATLGKLHWATALHLGKGVERNEEEALKWFREAAAEGDPDAQTFLATGNHTADRDLQGRSVAGQLAALGPQGQRLDPVAPPPDPAPASSGPTPLLALLAALIAAGALRRALPRHTPETQT